MAAPSVQLSVNDDTVKVFWEIDREGVYKSFKLYYSNNSSMSGEVAFSNTFINTPSLLYSSKHVIFTFIRNVLGFGTSGFYMRVKGILASTGLVDSSNPGATRYIPAENETLPENKVAMLYAYDATYQIWRKAISTKDPSSEGGAIHTV